MHDRIFSHDSRHTAPGYVLMGDKAIFFRVNIHREAVFHMRKSLQSGGPAADGKKILCINGLSALIILIFLLVLAGCSEDTTPVVEEPQPPGILIDYTRTGGIEGVMDHIVIFSDGQVVYSTREGSGAYVLSQGDMDILSGLIRDADIPSLNSGYPAPVQGADYFTYTLVIGNRTITTETTGIPAPLLPLITAMDGLISNH